MDFGVGLATISRDPSKIRELYAPDWKIGCGGRRPRHGTADDPRMVLIGVDIHAAYFLKSEVQPVVLYEMVRVGHGTARRSADARRRA